MLAFLVTGAWLAMAGGLTACGAGERAMAFVCFLLEWSSIWRTPQVVAFLAFSVMASGFSGPALNLLAVFCETSRDEIHREPAEDDIWRAEVHPEATDSGPGDSFRPSAA